MLFNSIEYLIFLPLVFILYWVLHKNYKKQNVLLLIGSYVFYGWWDYRFLALIIFSSLVDFYIGNKLYSATNQKSRKRFLLLSISSNLGLLAIFKYFNFFTDSFVDSMALLGWNVDYLTLTIILPVGISFYTFQTLSYTIDIYRKNLKPTQDIIAFFTYVSFFPQLVAGPIERAANLLPQIENSRIFRIDWFKAGIFQILIGLFRKIAIADNLGVYVDSVYENIEIHNSSTLMLATILYAFQIYFDFAGYSDIAIGSAKLFGFKFLKNFDFPYFSKSITEFWRKWHISLSFWLRDYLYISLGGNRKGIKITYRNLLITMVLGGLWHGSSWNFIIWGGIHGVFLSIEKLVFTYKKKNSFGLPGYMYTFFVVVFAWVFFRTQNFSDVAIFFSNFSKLNFMLPFIGNINVMVNSILMLLIGIGIDLLIKKSRFTLEEIGATFSNLKFSLAASAIILMSCLFYSSSDNFIYFQF